MDGIDGTLRLEAGLLQPERAGANAPDGSQEAAEQFESLLATLLVKELRAAQATKANAATITRPRIRKAGSST